MITCVASVEQFQDEVDRLKESVKDGLWLFRGQPERYTPGRELLPAIYREDTWNEKACAASGNAGARRFYDSKACKEAERGILDEFLKGAEKNLGSGYPKPEHDLERLALAQHYRLKTRVLDWTDDQLTALWFATCYSESSRAPTVWAFWPDDEDVVFFEGGEYKVKPANGITAPSEPVTIDSIFGNAQSPEVRGHANRTLAFRPVEEKRPRRLNAQDGWLVIMPDRQCATQGLQTSLECNGRYIGRIHALSICSQWNGRIKEQLCRREKTCHALFPDSRRDKHCWDKRCEELNSGILQRRNEIEAQTPNQSPTDA